MPFRNVDWVLLRFMATRGGCVVRVVPLQPVVQILCTVSFQKHRCTVASMFVGRFCRRAGDQNRHQLAAETSISKKFLFFLTSGLC